MSIDYGHDYEDEPWIDRDGDVIETPNAAPSSVHRGQTRFAYLLAESCGGKLLRVAGIGWFYWDGNRWKRDDIGKARQELLTLVHTWWSKALGDKELQADCKECNKKAGQDGALGIAYDLPDFAFTVDDIDADPYLLNVANGTLDLRALELRPHEPADKLTNTCNGAYLPGDTKDEVWQQFLCSVLPDPEVREFLQRLVGLALIGEVREHILPILTGSGRNGKGTFYEAVLFALGDYAASADPSLFLHRENAHPTGQMDLLGRRLVVVSESDRGNRLAEATMKRLTGGDRIKARHMRKDFVEFAPSHTAIMVTNHLPVVSGDDPAVWARIRVIPFAVVFGEARQDKSLRAKLEAEADAIISWAVEGWREYQRIGLAEPEAVRVATDEYKRASDPVGRFIEERCHVSPAVKIEAGELFELWQRWRIGEGPAAPEVSKKAFGIELGRRGFESRESNGRTWRLGITAQQSEGQWA